MVLDPKQIELNRIRDMIILRGYTITSSSFQDDRIVVKSEKVITPEMATTKDLESTWITNFLKQFGWAVTSSQVGTDRIVISFEKVIK